MHSTIWQTIAATPWWAYLLFFFLIQTGLQATKPRIVSFKNFMIVPSMLLAFAFYFILTDKHFNQAHALVWAGMTVIGFSLGFLQYRFLKIKAIRGSSKLYLPGSWSLLILLMMIFSIKYYLGYEMAIDPDYLQQPQYANFLYAIYGLFMGLFAGRTFYLLRCLRKGPFIEQPI